MMRLMLLLCVLAVAGCQGVVGPRERLSQPPPIGAPGLPADEQEAKVRSRLPFSSGGADIGPPTYFTNPLTREGR